MTFVHVDARTTVVEPAADGIPHLQGVGPVEADIQGGAIARADEVERLTVTHGTADGIQLAFVSGGQALFASGLGGLELQAAALSRNLNQVLAFQTVVHKVLL